MSHCRRGESRPDSLTWYNVEMGISHRSWVVIAILTAVLVALIMLAVWPAPGWLINNSNVEGLEGEAMANALNDIRQTLLQAIAGLVLFTGGVATWANVQVAHGRRKIEQARRRLEEQGQVTERFTRAIDQLGNNNTDVKIGGIYALERIAHDSPPYRSTILEVLAACIRGHARQPGRGSQAEDDAAEKAMTAGGRQKLASRAAEVQAALTVLGRLPGDAEKREEEDKNNGDAFYLRGTYLRGANLRRANLRLGNFRNADLEDAELNGADLRDANLRTAHLRNADLEGADLRGANLREAKLQKADLRDALLERADLQGAVGASSTKWGGFDWRHAGVEKFD